MEFISYELIVDISAYICLGGSFFTTLIPSPHSPTLGCALVESDQSSTVRACLLFGNTVDVTIVRVHFFGKLLRLYSAQLIIFHFHLLSWLKITNLSISTFYNCSATSITQKVSFLLASNCIDYISLETFY